MSKSNNKSKEETFLTEPPNKKKIVEMNSQALKIQEEIQKQNTLLTQIQEAELKLKFAQEQRTKLVTIKKQEIAKKDDTIEQMKVTNEQLQKELDILQTQVQESLDSMEYKEKNELFEKEKKKREEPLKQLLKVKEKQLSEIVQVNNKYKKEKEEIQKELEQKFNIEQINKLTSEIKIDQENI